MLGDLLIEIKLNVCCVVLEEDLLFCLLVGFELRIEVNVVGLCGGICRVF